jgi:hypothetical protein
MQSQGIAIDQNGKSGGWRAEDRGDFRDHGMDFEIRFAIDVNRGFAKYTRVRHPILP